MTALSPGTRVGEYRIEHPLGRGGMSEVYAATHILIGKRAAIKIMHPLLSADSTGMIRALQEARAVNQIGHPNIVDVYGYGKLDDGRAYLVMERLDGETLYERMNRRALGSDECRVILAQLCTALQAAHAGGVIHRDVKPANVFLMTSAESDRVKLLDFGLAKLLAGGSDLTLQGAVLGTPDYISPEQARGELVDGASDIYSLGVMAFEMFAGRLPFVAPDAREMLRQHLQDRPPPLRQFWPEAPTSLQALLDRMLAKEPARRPDLSEVRSGLEDPSSPPTSVALVRRLRPPNRLRLAALATVVSLAVGAAALAMRERQSPPPSTPPIVTATPRPAPALKTGTRLIRHHARPARKPHSPDDELLYPF